MEKTLGDRIREIRKECKLTQEAFGLKLGVSKTHIHKVEKGKGKMSHTLVMNIAFVFKVTYGWLMDGTGAKYPTDITKMRRVTPLSPYLELPEHMLPRDAGQPLSLVGDRDASDRSDIDKHRVTTLFEGEGSEYFEMLQRILSSNDETTKAAIKANLSAYTDHIKTKQEVEDLKRKVRRLGKSIASSPNPGKDGTDEA